MIRTSVFVGFYPDSHVSIGAIADRLTRFAGNVTRIDDIQTDTEHYCFVHFDQELPEIIWDVLTYGDEDTHGSISLDTPQGPIRVGLNIYNPLDPNTEDEITQYILNDAGLYSRNFKTGIVRKWNEEEMAWVDTLENPFVPPEYEDVEMEDAFTS